jgi:hypothetical protein
LLILGHFCCPVALEENLESELKNSQYPSDTQAASAAMEPIMTGTIFKLAETR